jgi:hypothetical protein
MRVMEPNEPMPAHTYGRWVQAFIAVMAGLALVGMECLLREPDLPPPPAPAGAKP